MQTHVSSTPTTNSIFTPQKYHGHMLDILGVLSDFGGLTVREISNLTGLPCKIIGIYCRRGARRGIIDRKESWGWSISSLGLLVLSLVNTTTTTTSNIKTTQQQHNSNITATQSSRQLDLAAFTCREDITECEHNVVGVLVNHYEKTNVKFKYFANEQDLADTLEISTLELRATLAHLTEEGCIYFRREALGWKVGLKKAFIERLQNV